MFNRILVPLDGSMLAERAIPHAEQFARVFASTLILLQVLDPSLYRESGTALEPLSWQIRKSEANLYLQGLAERLHDKGFKVEQALREGRAPENIIDYAQNENIDLLVLTTHGASGMSRWNSSSVVEKVIAKVYLPVLLIRSWQQNGAGASGPAVAAEASGAAGTAGAAGVSNAAGSTSRPAAYNEGDSSLASPSSAATAWAAVSPMSGDQAAAERRSAMGQTGPLATGARAVPVTARPADEPPAFYHRILLPIDSSRRAECSLAAGIALAEGLKTFVDQPADESSSEANEQPEIKLIVAAVIKSPEIPIPSPYPDELQQLSDRFLKISRETVQSYLNELKSRVPVDTDTRVVENDSISIAIHELVEQENADLVVLCAHGKTGRVTWPYGSVTHNYLEYGEKPVLVIQDVPRSQVRPTGVEIAAENYGRR